MHGRAAKRAVDVVVGTALAVVVTPLVLLFAAWLALTLRAWPFFVQTRIGEGGEPVRFLKLRTLAPSAPAYALKSDQPLVPPTRFAAALRARHLDELPQLYLVPLGRLSLVGPRPKMPDEFEPVDPFSDYAQLRTTVPQGCTGLWQIGAHKHLLPNQSPQYDLFYVRERTLAMDLWILGRTVLVLSGRAAPIQPADVPRSLWRSSRGGATPTVIDLTVTDVPVEELSAA